MLLMKKRLNSVYAKVSFLSAGIINDKSVISLTIDKTITNEQISIFPKDFSQVATSEMCNFDKRLFPKSVHSARPVLAAALGPIENLSRNVRPPLQPAAPQRA